MLLGRDGLALGRRLGHRRLQPERPGQQGEGAKANDILSFQTLAPSPLRPLWSPQGRHSTSVSAPLR